MTCNSVKLSGVFCNSQLLFPVLHYEGRFALGEDNRFRNPKAMSAISRHSPVLQLMRYIPVAVLTETALETR
jgi:hypothetical protein